MNRFDPTTAEIHQTLSAPDMGSHELSRRYFLQAAAAAGGAAMLSGMFADMAGAAAPLGASEGVLVIVWMEGGNDGLNTVVPINDGTYYDLRGSTAISPGAALDIGSGRGLHPELGYVQSLFQQGQVAIIDGVGEADNDLSHFESAARWMDGRVGHGAHTSGWIGRYLDGLPGTDPFHGVHIGRSVPLQMQGERRTATGVPVSPGGLFSPNASDVDQRQMAAIDAMAAGSTGLGELGDALAEAGRSSLAVASRLSAVYNPELPDADFTPDMILAARLINANLGLRVINVSYGDFDGHAGHPTMHADRMREFNAGLHAFHQTLDDRFANRTLVLTLSEFGRRPKANNSAGTDHGSASSLMAIGPSVVGGFHGAFPPLTQLDNRRNQAYEVDFRSVYANVLDTWLGGDSNEILGGTYGGLAMLGAPGSNSGGTGGSDPTPVTNVRPQIMRLYLAYFLRMPDPGGLNHWLEQARNGMSLARISQSFSESAEFRNRYGSVDDAGFVDQVYRNVMDREPDGGGRAFWIGRLGSGTTRGEMMIGFSESAEFVEGSAAALYDYDANGPVARLYQAYFLRPPDAGGLEFWNSQHMPLDAISEAFAASNEFSDLYGTLSNQAFVERVYQNVMGRSPDEGGRSFWTAQLYSGMRRGSVMLNFSESPEFVERFAQLNS